MQKSSPFQYPASEEQAGHINTRIDKYGLITLSSIPRVTDFFSSPRSPPATCLQDQVTDYHTRQSVEAPKILLATHDSQINYCVDSFHHSSIFSSHRQQFADFLGLFNHRNKHLRTDLPVPHYSSLFLQLPIRPSGGHQKVLLLYDW